jgi:hypothetical protein
MSSRPWLARRIERFLTRPRRYYEWRGGCEPAGLERAIRKCDVLLVEGDQRVSDVIKILTRSSWSHAALYVGDELLRGDAETRERALRNFGDDAHHMLVEAVFDGVVASPLRKYVDYNVRLCRPRRLRPGDAQRIVQRAIAAIGWRYDLRNVLDLALHLAVATLLPQRLGQRMLRFGSRIPTEVICTSLLGRLFHEVGFPVLPGEVLAAAAAPARERGALARLLPDRSQRPRAVIRRRDPTRLTPRDFDLSPFFEIVRIAAQPGRELDYREVEWVEETLAGEPRKAGARRPR